MSDNKRIAKNTLFLYFRMMLIMGVNLYVSRVVLRTLGVEDFGLYNVVGGIVTMFTFLNGALGGATSRFITLELGKKNYGRLNQIFNTALAIHVCIALAIFVLAETVGLWLFFEKMTIPAERLNASLWVYQISIITCFFSLTQVPYNATIIAHEEMKVYAYVGIVEVFARLAIAFLLFISPVDKLVFYALLLFLLQTGVMLFYRFYCTRKYKECRIRVYREKALYKDMFSYAGISMIGNLSVMAQGQGLNLLLNIFFSPVVNAARGIAYQVQGAIIQFSNNFMTAVSPQIVKRYAEGNVEDMMKLVVQSSCFSFYLLLLLALPICLEADYILKLWLGEYPPYTTTFLILIVLLCLIQSLNSPRTTVFQATGKIALVNLTVGVILCMVFPLAYLFLKMGGEPEMVFVAAIITVVCSDLVSIFVLKKYVNFSVRHYLKEVHLRCFSVLVLSSAISYYLFDLIPKGGWRFIYTCFVSCCSTSICCFYVGMRREMRLNILNFIIERCRMFCVRNR